MAFFSISFLLRVSKKREKRKGGAEPGHFASYEGVLEFEYCIAVCDSHCIFGHGREKIRYPRELHDGVWLFRGGCDGLCSATH